MLSNEQLLFQNHGYSMCLCKLCNYVSTGVFLVSRCVFIVSKKMEKSESLQKTLKSYATWRSSCNHTILVTLSRGTCPILIAFLILYYTHSYICSLLILIVTCGFLIICKFMWFVTWRCGMFYAYFYLKHKQ